ncbi:MAG: calcium-binding protein, partial [Alphaproteobacteria bacterium]|nr:calcium-binding protein [Alphaproteobacteria bacterium]
MAETEQGQGTFAQREVTVEMPPPGEAISIGTQRGMKINLEGIDLENVKVDILGSDVIISDPSTGAQIILVSMALFMFDEDGAPLLFMGGREIMAHQLLAGVGEVGNLSVKDYIEISSLLPQRIDQSQAEQKNQEKQQESDSEQQSSDQQSEQSSTAEMMMISMSVANAQFKTEAPDIKRAEKVEDFTSNAPATAIDEKGTFEWSATEDSSSSATSTSEGVGLEIEDKEADPEPAEVILFEARLLQVASQSATEDVGGGVFKRVFDGGGGSEASFFNPDNEVQYSTEVINLTDDSSDLVVYADNPDYFDADTMSRVIELATYLPDGFKVTRVVFSDLPSGFVILNAENGSDGYSIDSPQQVEAGNYQFIVQYDVPNTRDFEIGIKIEAEFDPVLYETLNPDAPLIIPTETVVELKGQQKVEVKDVFGSNDLNYEDSDGNTVWVLANGPNNNRIFTSSGDDIVYGANANDVINAAEGDDILFGYAGDDTLIGGDGNDWFSPGPGDDLIQGDAGVDTVDFGSENPRVELNLGLIIGGYAIAVIDEFGPNYQEDRIRDVENISTGNAADILTGDAAANILETRGGNDLIYASGGADILDGGSGTDTLDFSTLSLVVNFISITLNTSNNATVTVDGGTNQTVRNIENVTGTRGNDTIVGDSLNNTLRGADGDDVLAGRGGADVLDGGDGSDTASYMLAALNGVVVDLQAGGASNDGDDGTDSFISIENVFGSAYDDVIDGDGAANILFGFGGDDVIYGAGGDDVFLASDGADELDGGTGVDTVDYSSLAGVQFINVTLAGAADALVTVDGGTDDIVRNIENVIGSAGGDHIYGDDFDNILSGFDGADLIGGGGGDDVLDGGQGEDTADYSAAHWGVHVDLANGEASDDGQGGRDTLLNFENVTGSAFSDVLRGDGQVNRLTGGVGADYLYGADGDDTLDGGAGNDTADYLSATDRIVVDMSLNRALDDGDGGVDTFVSIENVRGSVHDDVISGDSDDNILRGDEGDDELYGAGGDDLLEGQGGDDLLLASEGADTLDGGTGNDTVNYSVLADINFISVTLAGAGNATVMVDGGTNDTIRNVENIVATAGNDIVTGDIFDNVIQGLGGNDVIRGGAGDDILDGGDGFDTLRFDELTGLGVILDLEGSTAAYSVDSSLDRFSNFENYFTTLNDDIIFGSGSADIVSGLAGSDLFKASHGNDTLDGGTGSDTLDYSDLAGINFINVGLDGSSNVTVTVNGGNNDTVRNFENVIGTVGADTISGDDFANTLEGRGGADVLSGGGGGDRLEGGSGSDILIGGAGDDVLMGGDGIDTADYSLSASVNVNLASGEALSDGLGGTDLLDGIENIVGSSQSDFLVGNGVANSISAGSGNDIVSGGGGSDSLWGGIGNDQLRFDDLTGLGINIDLQAGTAYYAGDGSTDNFYEFEEFYLTNQSDEISGSTGSDHVFGGDGADIFRASAGADTLDGGAGSDTIDYSALGGVTGISVTLNSLTPTTVTVTGGDNDTIVNFENVTGSTGADFITGDEFSNIIRGSGGNDVIRGGGGSDVLDGGEGTDTVRFDDLSGAGIILDIGARTADFAGDSSRDTLLDFEVYYTSNQADEIRGSAGIDTVYALNGADIFYASAGADILDGGHGSDTIDYSALSGIGDITVTLNGSTPVTVTLSNGDDDLIVSIENVTGAAGDDVLTGDDQDNTLRGAAGNDGLDGGEGNDTLEGGLGDDWLYGGGGVDFLRGGAGIDTADYGGAGLSVEVDLSLGQA